MLLNSVRIGAWISKLDLNIPPFDPTRIAHAQAKRSDTRFRFGIIFGGPNQYAYPSPPFCLLRASCERPAAHGTANNRDELAPPHLPPHGSGRSIVAAQTCLGKGPSHVRFGSKADVEALP